MIILNDTQQTQLDPATVLDVTIDEWVSILNIETTSGEVRAVYDNDYETLASDLLAIWRGKNAADIQEARLQGATAAQAQAVVAKVDWISEVPLPSVKDLPFDAKFKLDGDTGHGGL